jgi:hypothetical protein
MGTYTGGPVALPVTRLPSSRSACTRLVVGKMATISKIGCAPSRNSYGFTRNCNLPRNKHELDGVAQTKG